MKNGKKMPDRQSVPDRRCRHAEDPFFSFVIPVRDAAVLIPACLSSIRALDYPQDRVEVILADGVSQDRSREVGAALGAIIIDNPRRIVASGRNVGVARARGEFVVFTDADCVLRPDYLANALVHLSDPRVGGICGPTITPMDGSLFEKAVAVVFDLATVLLGSVHREKIATCHEVRDMPGCNSIYRLRALSRVLPIDEDLLTAEDVDLNFRMRQDGAVLLACPDVILFHHRRSSPRAAVPLGIGGFLGLVWWRTSSLRLALHVLGASLTALAGWSTGFLRELFVPLRDTAGK